MVALVLAFVALGAATQARDHPATKIIALLQKLEADIAQITTDVSTDEASKASADTQREAANAEYLSTKSDLEGTITAVETAITSLGNSDQSFTQVQKNAVKQALAFVDIYAPEAASKKVHAFLQQREEP